MKQMSQYMATEAHKFGPNVYKSRPVVRNVTKQYDHPILANLKTMTWYVYDDKIREYIDTGAPIKQEEKKPSDGKQRSN